MPGVKGSPPQLHMRRRTPSSQKGRGAQPKSVLMTPRPLCSGIHLSQKRGTQIGKGPGCRQLWEIRQDKWPKENNDLEDLSHASDLNHLPGELLLREGAGPCPPLWGALLSCFCLQQTTFLCALPQVVLWLNTNSVPACIVSASLKEEGKNQGNSAFSLELVKWLGFLVATQAAQVQFMSNEHLASSHHSQLSLQNHVPKRTHVFSSNLPNSFHEQLGPPTVKSTGRYSQGLRGRAHMSFFAISLRRERHL